MAGGAPDNDTYDYVYVYDINSNNWDILPPPGRHKGILQIINSNLINSHWREGLYYKQNNKQGDNIHQQQLE